MSQDSTDLPGPAIRLLKTYGNGPRIWDAASLIPMVTHLQGLGLIAPALDGPASTITEAGRAVLAAAGNDSRKASK